MNNLNKISIITVCYNAEKEIEETIISVINQNYKNKELIIIDGMSDDNTLKIIKKFAKRYDFIKYISEPDKGIYDAMNKGIEYAKGEVIHFLNAGDFFSSQDILEKASYFMQKNDIIYGNAICMYKNKKIIAKPPILSYKSFIMEKSICHQAIFCRKSIFNNIGDFDLEYKYCADYDWTLRAFICGIKMKYVDLNVVNYDMNGVSADFKNRYILAKEREKIINKNCNKILFILIKIKHSIGLIKRNIMRCKIN